MFDVANFENLKKDYDNDYHLENVVFVFYDSITHSHGPVNYAKNFNDIVRIASEQLIQLEEKKFPLDNLTVYFIGYADIINCVYNLTKHISLFNASDFREALNYVLTHLEV